MFFYKGLLKKLGTFLTKHTQTGINSGVAGHYYPFSEVQAKDNGKKEKPRLVKEPKHITVPDSAVVEATPTPPAKPASTAEVQVREHHNEKLRPTKDQKLTKVPKSAVVPAPPCPLAKPASITEGQAKDNDNDKPKLVKQPKPITVPDSSTSNTHC